MEDRYLFRAKRIDNGEWVCGSYVYTFCEDKNRIVVGIKVEKHWIVEESGNMVWVDKSTICQCTGLKDKNGNLIWENDICNYYNPEDKDGIGIIKNDYVLWIDGTISMRHKMTPLFYLQCKDEWEVIGNVFDNPELLESEE